MTSARSLPAQIEAVHRAIETRDHQSEQFAGARYDAEALRAVLATLQQHERLEAVVKAARQWRLSLEDDGWDERAIMDLARPGIYALFSALAALDSAAPETPANTELVLSRKDVAENSGGRR